MSSNLDGNPMNITLGDCYCINDTDEDGICDDMEIVGCQNETACNYDATATDSGDCTYPETYYNCDETCITDSDEDGVCDELSIYEELIPTNYSISSIYPNPFNPTTVISFSIPEFGFTTITVYDITGRELETLINEAFELNLDVGFD